MEGKNQRTRQETNHLGISENTDKANLFVFLIFIESFGFPSDLVFFAVGGASARFQLSQCTHRSGSVGLRIRSGFSSLRNPGVPHI